MFQTIGNQIFPLYHTSKLQALQTEKYTINFLPGAFAGIEPVSNYEQPQIFCFTLGLYVSGLFVYKMPVMFGKGEIVWFHYWAFKQLRYSFLEGKPSGCQNAT